MTNKNFLDKIHRINLIRKFNKEQEKINQQYEEEGLTDELLEKQVLLNQQRHEHNIPDTSQNVYKNFVQ